jgi:hypothetical protein
MLQHLGGRPCLNSKRLGLCVALLLASTIVAQSEQPSRDGSPSPLQPKANADQRGTEQAPLIVKVVPKTNAEAAQEAQEKRDKSAADWWLVRLTGVLGAVGFLQLLVFGWQGWQLRKTVRITRDAGQSQSQDMAAAIAQSARAASAMESVAESMGKNVISVQESVATTKANWAAQMRAYLSISPGALIEQDDNKEVKIELQPWIVNNGLTPAHEVRYNAKVQVLRIPIADNFTFPLPPMAPAPSTTTVGPRQQTFMITAADDLLARNVLAELKQPGGRRLVIYGTVTYKDAFGNPWWTNFCYFIIWGSAGQPAWIAAHRHNEST